MSKNEFEYNINHFSEKVFKTDGTPIKLSPPFLAAREVSRAGSLENFLDKHYQERKHYEWQQEDPCNNDWSLEEIRELEKIAEFEESGEADKIFVFTYGL